MRKCGSEAELRRVHRRLSHAQDVMREVNPDNERRRSGVFHTSPRWFTRCRWAIREYVDSMIGSARLLVMAVLSWLGVLGWCFAALCPESKGCPWHRINHGIADSALSIIAIQPSHTWEGMGFPYVALSVVSMAVGWFHLGLLISLLFVRIGRTRG